MNFTRYACGKKISDLCLQACATVEKKTFFFILQSDPSVEYEACLLCVSISCPGTRAEAQPTHTRLIAYLTRLGFSFEKIFLSYFFSIVITISSFSTCRENRKMGQSKVK